MQKQKLQERNCLNYLSASSKPLPFLVYTSSSLKTFTNIIQPPVGKYPFKVNNKNASRTVINIVL